MKYFHIDYKVRMNWFAPILARFHSTENSNWPAEYALGLTTKFEILAVLRSDITRAITELDQEFRQNQSDVDRLVAERGKMAGPYPLNPDLAFRTVAALECFILEAFATWDIALAFAVRLCRNLKRQMDTRTVEEELNASGVNLSWVDMREKLRNWHTHEGSIWIAVEVSTDNPRTYKLIILRRNTLDLANTEDWIAWDKLQGLYQGLNEGVMGLQTWLMQQLEPTKASSPD
jgi:hypothetical protein